MSNEQIVSFETDKSEFVMDLQLKLEDLEFAEMFLDIFGVESMYDIFESYVNNAEDEELDEVIDKINNILERKTNE